VHRMHKSIQRYSQAEYHWPQSLEFWIIVLALNQEQTRISLSSVHMSLFIYIISQECFVKVQLENKHIAVGCDCEWQPIMTKESSQYIYSLAVDTIDMVIFSSDKPFLEPLHMASCIMFHLPNWITYQIRSVIMKHNIISKVVILIHFM